jgi:hypothetical protein
MASKAHTPLRRDIPLTIHGSPLRTVKNRGTERPTRESTRGDGFGKEQGVGIARSSSYSYRACMLGGRMGVERVGSS